jgi:mono/diheme cytochrome c family protein
MKAFLVGLLLGVALVIGGIYYYFSSGHAPVATKDPEMLFEHKLAHIAQHAYLDRLPHPKPAVPQDEQNFLEGAKIYKANCAGCHGLPGLPKSAIADGMFPPPPQLFKGVGVTDDEPWETYWKVSGGLRMSGMPGFSQHLSETQMWQVSVLLKNADTISPAVKTELTSPLSPPPAPAAAPTPASASAPLEHK